MATEKTIKNVVNMLFQSPLANKPKPIAGQTEIVMIQALVKLYAMTLQDIDDQLLKAAVVNHIATEKWFPAIADIRSSALSLVSRADSTPSAYEAWQEVKIALRKFGSWRIEEGENSLSPATAKAVRYFGGLKEFCLMEASDESSWRMRFIDAYNGVQQREAENAMTLPAISSYIEKRMELNGKSVSELMAGLTSKLTVPRVDKK